jgi:hypothetical protein
LDFAWKIPIIYRNNEMDVVFHYKNRIVPSIDGRNVRIKDFTEKLIKKFKNANVDTVIGVRHGSWTIGDTFSDCLAQANGADDEARIYRNQNMDRIVDHINNVNEKIKYVWNKGNCRQSKGITRSKT